MVGHVTCDHKDSLKNEASVGTARLKIEKMHKEHLLMPQILWETVMQICLTDAS